MPLTSPSDHGMSRNSISAAMPREAIVHMVNVTIAMNAGQRRPLPRVRGPPGAQRHGEVQGHEPRARDDQRQPHVEGPVGLQRRIEREHDGRRIAEERDGGEHEAGLS